MKKTTIKLSLATLVLLGSTTLFAGAVAEGSQTVQSGEIINLDGSQSFTEQGGDITEYKWYRKNLTNPVREVTPVVSQEVSASFVAPEVKETTRFQYTLNVVELINNKNTLYSKSSIVVTVEPNSDESNTTITHEGFTYGTVVSPKTGRTWLDRNLGASKACTSKTDSACYGAYYQWGRNTDGHQLLDSESTFVSLPSLSTISNEFINIDYDNYGRTSYDWVEEDRNGAIREARWSATDGSSICPVGYRVPTPEEYAYETNLDFLNLAYAGVRGTHKGYISHFTTYLWTNTHHLGYNNHSTAFVYGNIDDYGFVATMKIKQGASVRCIKLKY